MEMNKLNLKEQLNCCRSPQFIRIADLRPGIPYKVIRFEKTTTRYGETVAVTLEGLVGDDFYLRVYLPQRYMASLNDVIISSYNNGEGERLSLQYRGGTSGIDFV